jgi:hypothetical protein
MAFILQEITHMSNIYSNLFYILFYNKIPLNVHFMYKSS